MNTRVDLVRNFVEITIGAAPRVHARGEWRRYGGWEQWRGQRGGWATTGSGGLVQVFESGVC